MKFISIVTFIVSILAHKTQTANAQAYSLNRNLNQVIQQPNARGKFIGPFEIPNYEGYCGQAAAANMISLCPLPACSKMGIAKFPSDDMPGTAPNTIINWMNSHRICGKFSPRIIPDVANIKAPAFILVFIGKYKQLLHWITIEEVELKANGDCFVQYVDGKRTISTCEIFNLRFAPSSTVRDLKLGIGQFLVLESQITKPDFFDYKRGTVRCSPKDCETNCKNFLGAESTGTCSLTMESEGPLFDQRVCSCRERNGNISKVNFYENTGELCRNL